jgi:hypothetical protein
VIGVPCVSYHFVPCCPALCCRVLTLQALRPRALFLLLQYCQQTGVIGMLCKPHLMSNCHCPALSCPVPQGVDTAGPETKGTALVALLVLSGSLLLLSLPCFCQCPCRVLTLQALRARALCFLQHYCQLKRVNWDATHVLPYPLLSLLLPCYFACLT